MLLGVIIVFNLYVENPESQFKKFILPSSCRIWHISLSSSCTVHVSMIRMQFSLDHIDSIEV